ILDAGARDVPTHIEDLVPRGQTVVALTLGGYLKRLDDTGGRNAGRDPIVAYVDAGTRDTLLLFSAKGQAYGVPVHRIGAVDSTDGKSEILLSTKAGKAIRFKEDEVRTTGRVAGGVRGIKLEAGDEVLRGPLVPRLPLVVTFTEGGYARRTPLEDYPLQGRDGGGVKAMR